MIDPVAPTVIVVAERFIVCASLVPFALCVIVPDMSYVAILPNADPPAVKLSKLTVPLSATVNVLIPLIVEPDVIVNIKFAGIVSADGPLNVPCTLNIPDDDADPKLLALNVKLNPAGTT